MTALWILIRSELKAKYRNLLKLGFLSILAISFMTCSITLYRSGLRAVSSIMDTLGYGDVTVWTENAPEDLAVQVAGVPTVRAVTNQPLIYAGYRIGERFSDNEGQLLTWQENIPYRFIDSQGRAILQQQIQQGEIYISPALASSFEVSLGSTISFSYSRTASPITFTVRGYFEDAFMGSSMIDMKSFLISTSDFEDLLKKVSIVKEADRIAIPGAMLHISGAGDLQPGELLKSVMKETGLSLYTKFAYTKESILSYMLLLQNILCAFLGAFSILLFVIGLIASMRNLSDTIEEESDDIGTLRMLGASGKRLRTCYFLVFFGTFLLGGIIALPVGIVFAKVLAERLVSSTGLLIVIDTPAVPIALLFVFALALQGLFFFFRTARILGMRPIAIGKGAEHASKKMLPAIAKPLPFTLASRELLTGKRKYAGLFLIALLLTIFLSVVGRMTAWLGTGGEGLMNAFSVADHDLGIQPFDADVPMDEIERAINWYSPIRETYEIAMQPVYVNGREYTANVLNKTSYFHVLRGNNCEGDEILITDTVANELGLSIGDSVQITGVGRTEKYTVSGIYMCANGMGSNIGMSLAGYSKIGDINRFIWCHHYILENGAVRDYAASFLRENYRGIDVHTNSWTGLDGIVRLMHLLIMVLYMVAALFIGVAVALISKSLIRSEEGTFAVYRTLGMRHREIRLSFALRFVLIVLAGCMTGVIFSELFADRLIGRICIAVGIGEFRVRALALGILTPLILIPLLFFLFSFTEARKAAGVSMVKTIQEEF